MLQESQQTPLNPALLARRVNFISDCVRSKEEKKGTHKILFKIILKM